MVRRRLSKRTRDGGQVEDHLHLRWGATRKLRSYVHPSRRLNMLLSSKEWEAVMSGREEAEGGSCGGQGGRERKTGRPRLLQKKGRQGKGDVNVDCIMIRKNPFEEEPKTIIDLSSELSSSDSGNPCSNDSFLQQQLQRHQEHESSNEDDEVSIVGVMGQSALRDYPHARHLCVEFPFSKTPHESHCNQCYCYVCDTPAPCEQWNERFLSHCNATEQDSRWRRLRFLNRKISQ